MGTPVPGYSMKVPGWEPVGEPLGDPFLQSVFPGSLKLRKRKKVQQCKLSFLLQMSRGQGGLCRRDGFWASGTQGGRSSALLGRIPDYLHTLFVPSSTFWLYEKKANTSPLKGLVERSAYWLQGQLALQRWRCRDMYKTLRHCCRPLWDSLQLQGDWKEEVRTPGKVLNTCAWWELPQWAVSDPRIWGAEGGEGEHLGTLGVRIPALPFWSCVTLEDQVMSSLILSFLFLSQICSKQCMG